MWTKEGKIIMELMPMCSKNANEKGITSTMKQTESSWRSDCGGAGRKPDWLKLKWVKSI